jgi:two-component system LytT family response regulator
MEAALRLRATAGEPVQAAAVAGPLRSAVAARVPVEAPAADSAAAAGPLHQPWLRRIAVRSGDRILLLDVSAIEWIEGADYYSRIHSRGSSWLVRRTLAALAARLDPAEFCRVHRSAIVNVNRVREIHPFFGGSRVLVLDTGARVVLSRRRRGALELVLGQDI